MDVYWLEQTANDVPTENDWLSANETVRLSALHFAKRRADWRLGRWTAKRAVAAYMHLPAERPSLRRIEVRATASGAPEIFFAGKPALLSISLSHSNGVAVCALAAPGTALGCDLELVEPRSDAFVSDYFTAEEQALIAEALPTERPRVSTMLWSAKESALKALSAGLRLDTRWVAVSPADALPLKVGEESPDWRPFYVHYIKGQVFYGWWQKTGDLLRTMVATPPPVPPILLTI